MKVKFFYPVKKEEGIELSKMSIKTNVKFVFSYYNKRNKVDWIITSHAKERIVVVLGSYNLRDYYWCNTIPFDTIEKTFPILKADAHKWKKKGYHADLLEAIFKKNELGIKKSIDKINKDQFKIYLNEEYGIKL